MAGIDVQMWLTFAVVLGTIAAFSVERIPVEVAALGALVALVLIFVAGPDFLGTESPLSLAELLAGFANPALVAILALIIVGQALFQTGALDRPTQLLARSSPFSTATTIGLTVAGAATLSAFLNNTPVVVMFIPVLIGIARERRVPGSRALLPMNFATILGGMTTLIGSSTNLLVAEVAARASDIRLGIFDITVPGLALALPGVAYAIFVVPRILRDREAEGETRASGKQFIAELVLEPGHPLVGLRSVAGFFAGLRHVTVRLVERGEETFLPPFEDLTLRPGDRVVFAGMRRELAQLGIIQPPPSEGAPVGSQAGGISVAEAIVAPGSRLVSRPPDNTGIEHATGAHVVAIERHGRLPRGTFAEMRLEAGDVLLVAGTETALDRLRGNRDLLLLERSLTALPMRESARKALLIFALMVSSAATGLVSITVAALVAVLLVLAFGCLNVRQARRAFDGRIFMLVGASIALASALEATGGAAYLADHLVALTREGGPVVLLSALFALIALLTNVLSNNATAVLFTPVALSAAASTGAPPEPFVVAVIMAANCSFATPIGYQTNLLVMGPGGYRFSDYVIAGGPLVVLLWAIFSFFAPLYYGL